MQKPFIQKFLPSNKPAAYLISIVALLASLWLAASIGTVRIPVALLWDRQSYPMEAAVFFDIRLPRVILAGLIGASLAVAGGAFQGLLKNPLADPYTLGVSSGASVGAVAVLFFGISLPAFGLYTLPLFSAIAAFLTMLIVLLFSRMIDRNLKMETLILTGIVMTSFLGSVMSLMISLTGEELRSIIGWLLGSVSLRGWPYVWLLLPFFLFGLLIVLLNTRELNAMMLGEEKAKHIGVSVNSRKLWLLLSGSVLAGAAVAVSGTIGFVGLVVPHIVRRLWGADHRHLVPLSALNGATLLVLCDLVARTIISPTELPIGVITAFIGAPLFAFILWQQRKGGRAHAPR